MGQVSPVFVKTLSTYKQPPKETTHGHLAKTDEMFLADCVKNNTQPTKRQYGKWTRLRGQAFGRSKAGRPIDKFGTEQP